MHVKYLVQDLPHDKSSINVRSHYSVQVRTMLGFTCSHIYIYIAEYISMVGMYTIALWWSFTCQEVIL